MYTFATNLKKQMDAKGLSVEELAQATDIPEAAIRSYLKGKLTPGRPRLKALCIALQVKPGDLWGLNEIAISPNYEKLSGLQKSMVNSYIDFLASQQ